MKAVAPEKERHQSTRAELVKAIFALFFNLLPLLLLVLVRSEGKYPGQLVRG